MVGKRFSLLHLILSCCREDEKLGRRERYLGPTSDFKEKDGYKPNIKLEYIDDDGHILSAKEAFRYAINEKNNNNNIVR